MDMTADAIDKIVRLSRERSIVSDDILISGQQVVVVPEGYELSLIDPIDKPLPASIHATVRHDTDESFIAYVNDFKDDAMRMFVERAAAKVTVIFDYHRNANDPGVLSSNVGRLTHKAVYPMPWSPQWLRWKGLADRPGVNQKTFMEFIEENGEDITAPAWVDLIDMVSRVQSKKNIEFTSGLRLSDGSIEVAYKEEAEHSGGSLKTVTMPSEIEIGIPVFVDGPAYAIKVFIRYEVDQGKLAFKIVLHRWEFTVEDAMKTAVAKIEEATGLTAHWGVVER